MTTPSANEVLDGLEQEGRKKGCKQCGEDRHLCIGSFTALRSFDFKKGCYSKALPAPHGQFAMAVCANCGQPTVLRQAI